MIFTILITSLTQNNYNGFCILYRYIKKEHEADMKPQVRIIVCILVLLPTMIYPQQYWMNYAQNLIKEQKQIENKPYIESFVLEYLASRIALAQKLSAAYSNVTLNDNTALPILQTLSLCDDKSAQNITYKTIDEALHYIQCSTKDVCIIHTELLLSSLYEKVRTHNTVSPENSSQVVPSQKLISFNDLTQSVRFKELHSMDIYAGMREHLVTSIEQLLSCTLDKNSPIEPQVLSLLSTLEKSCEYTSTYPAPALEHGGITYQITIPKPCNFDQAISDIVKKRDMIVTVKDELLIDELESIAHSYISPVKEEIAQQQKMLAIIKSTNGMAIENEETFNTYVSSFEKKSRLLLDYTQGTILYCRLALCEKPIIDYNARYTHIIHLARNLQNLISQYPGNSDLLNPSLRIMDILKAFVCADNSARTTNEITNTLAALHDIKVQIQNNLSGSQETPNPLYANLDVSTNIESLEKGIALFTHHTYAKEALTRYSMIVNQAIDSLQKGNHNDSIHIITRMKSVIPAVPQFDVKKIIHEYYSQKYLLHRLRADCLALVQRIELYHKKGILITNSTKAKELFEKIQALQPLYTVNAGKYKMNQNNMLLVDKHCAAMITRMANSVKIARTL